jgi:hypothetical protein
MSARKWITVLVLIALVALFVPFVPMTQSSGQLFAAHYQQSAHVSPSYYLFHCGSYLDPQTSFQLGSGYAGFYQIEKGYTFNCDYSSG